MIRTIPLFLILVLFSGCGAISVPDRFHLLTASPPEEVVPLKETDLHLTIEKVHVRRFLDRPELISKETDNTLILHEADRWVEPLADNVAYVLAQDIESRSGLRTAIGHDPDSIGIRVSVEDLTRTHNLMLSFRMRYWIRKGNGHEMGPFTFEREIATPPGADGAISGASLLMGKLAEDILTRIP